MQPFQLTHFLPDIAMSLIGLQQSPLWLFGPPSFLQGSHCEQAAFQSVCSPGSSLHREACVSSLPKETAFLIDLAHLLPELKNLKSQPECKLALSAALSFISLLLHCGLKARLGVLHVIPEDLVTKQKQSLQEFSGETKAVEQSGKCSVQFVKAQVSAPWTAPDRLRLVLAQGEMENTGNFAGNCKDCTKLNKV